MKQTWPKGVSPDSGQNKKYVSLDGDADRLIYFYIDDKKQFHMLDGDRIATVFATWIVEELEKVKSLNLNANLGIVQTAYANGSSTKYIKEVLKVEPVFTKTGVKHLHHKALEYDIGVYFEANGHGTTIFKPEFEQKLNDLAKKYENEPDSELKSALIRLANLPRLINQATGDSLSDILMVESVLLHKQWKLPDVDKMYNDLPQRLKAVKVKDKNDFVTTDIETELIEPKGLQNKLNDIIKQFPQGRSFIRPSGTENVVRIYAEAATQEDTEKLSNLVEDLLKDFQ